MGDSCGPWLIPKNLWWRVPLGRRGFLYAFPPNVSLAIEDVEFRKAIENFSTPLDPSGPLKISSNHWKFLADKTLANIFICCKHLVLMFLFWVRLSMFATTTRRLQIPLKWCDNLRAKCRRLDNAKPPRRECVGQICAPHIRSMRTPSSTTIAVTPEKYQMQRSRYPMTTVSCDTKNLVIAQRDKEQGLI